MQGPGIQNEFKGNEIEIKRIILRYIYYFMGHFRFLVKRKCSERQTANYYKNGRYQMQQIPFSQLITTINGSFDIIK